MATRFEDVKKHLEDEGLDPFAVPEKSLLVIRFETETYRNPSGKHLLEIAVILEEEGRFIKIIAPHLYILDSRKSREPLFETLLSICWETKMVQYEYRAEDNVVRSIIEFPIEDSHLTKDQLKRCVSNLVLAAETYHLRIRQAIDAGAPIRNAEATRPPEGELPGPNQ